MNRPDKKHKRQFSKNQSPNPAAHQSLSLRLNAEIPQYQSFQSCVSDNSDNSDKRASGIAHVIYDNMGKIKIKLPKLYDGAGSVTGDWYIGFYCFNPATGRLQRFKKTEGFLKLKTYEEKKSHGDSLVAKYTGMLRDGWDPFQNNRIIYQDQISSPKEFVRSREAHYNIEYYLNLFIFEKKKELRDKSVYTYLAKIRKLNKWLEKKNLNNISIEYFSADHAQEFVSVIKAQRPHPNTLHSYIVTYRTAWNWLDERFENLISKNPWNKIKSRKVKGTPQKPFSAEQREFILNHLLSIGERHLWLACLTIYYCYVRPGRELHGLQVKHIDLISNKININRDIAKNKKSEAVNMPTHLAKCYKEIKQYNPEWFVFGIKGVAEKRCFKDYWSKRFTRVIRPLGFGQEYSMYSWKHTGNQVAHQNGMPLEKQRKLNRHHSLDEMQTYLAGLEIENSEEMDKYFGN